MDEGSDLLELIRELYPLTRSITGDGVRTTLRRLTDIVPMEIHEVPTGTKVLDWEIPREWNIRDAYIRNESGEKIVDFRDSNLHVMSYSTPVHETLTRDQLLPHLHSDPEKPEWIPYRTSYYSEGWGFCVSDNQLQQIPAGNYEVFIDSTLEAGSLTYGEVVIPGRTDEQCIFYTHICHPSLCNDNLSGIAVCAYLAKWLQDRDNHFTYRVIFAPGTIGSITWLAQNQETLSSIRHGLVLALLGDGAPLHYKQTRNGNAEIDRIVQAYLSVEQRDSQVSAFSPWGYDERQFGSPGFALPVGRLTRSAEEGYAEYHTSADNLELVSSTALAAALSAVQDIVEILDSNRRYRNLAPHGEPQLGRRGIYRDTGGAASPELQRALLWVLSLSDGDHDLVEIYKRSALHYKTLLQAVEMLAGAGLLEQIDGN